MLTKLGKVLLIAAGIFVLVVFVAMSIANSPPRGVSIATHPASRRWKTGSTLAPSTSRASA